ANWAIINNVSQLEDVVEKKISTIFYLPVESEGLPLSIKSINWLSLGVMMISVRLFFTLPSGVSLLATGLYSPRPPAVRRFGSTPKLFCSDCTTEEALNALKSQLLRMFVFEIGTLSVLPSINTS